jgi:hypothetical protein
MKKLEAIHADWQEKGNPVGMAVQFNRKEFGAE